MEKNNYYNYVNKKWLKETKIPSHATSWSNFNILAEQNQKRLFDLIEGDKEGGVLRSIVNLYTDRNDTSGLLEIVDRIKKAGDENVYDAFGVANSLGIDTPISIGIARDQKEAVYTLHICQGGLTLPSVDYYEKYAPQLTEFFTKFMQKTKRYHKFSTSAEALVDFEKELAALHLKPVERRDVIATYNKIPISSLSDDLQHQFLVGYGFRAKHKVTLGACIVESPKYLEKVGCLIAKHKSSNLLQDYLVAQTIMGLGGYAVKSFQKLFFDFFNHTLRGQVKQKPLWRRKVAIVSSLAGDNLGEAYRKKYFTRKDKAAVVRMIRKIKEQLSRSIETSSWMQTPTKKKALEKLRWMKMKIGYSSKPKLIKSSDVKESLLRTVLHLHKKEHLRMMGRLLRKKPVENKWYMHCYEVNAYYSPQDNEIVFPAGILQAPYYDKDQSDAQNYAGIGAIVGHEITHGFDDQGCRFDAEGVMNNWWTDIDFKKYEAKTKLIERQFDQYAVGGIEVNGSLTLGENIADIGGFVLAYRATKLSDDEKREFMEHWALIWRNKRTTQSLEEQLLTDPHSPGEVRVNGVLSTIPDFYKLYSITEKDAMYLPEKKRSSVW